MSALVNIRLYISGLNSTMRPETLVGDCYGVARWRE